MIERGADSGHCKVGPSMTLRELLKSLQAVDEKNLDMEVLVSPHTGGYDGISHVSVLYVGAPVIHLAEPRPAEPPPDLWESQEGAVPAVSPDDLRSVWKLTRDAQARNPGECTSIGNTVYQRVCSPGADAVAVWYRASMLGMLQIIPESPLAQWTHDGELDDVVFQVAATFPIEKMRTGVVREGMPFDVEEFVKQIGAGT
jgi:hypothetical protein